MNLFSKFTLGDLELSNRIAMSPMTRSRAVEGNVPNPIADIYYVQRASAGLIITEGTPVSPLAYGYIRTPGIHTREQVAGWKHVTEAVHKAGGIIFAQLWHGGRIAHPYFLNGELPIAPSAIAAEGEAFTPEGFKKLVTPRALELDEIPVVVEQFRKAAENAKTAGFDGVELHGANSYLLDQFLRDSSNQRTDAYGGSIAKRARFPLEVTEAVISVWGAKRVGYKMSPYFLGNSMSDSDPVATFSYLAERLSSLGVVYIDVGEAIAGPMAVSGVTRVTPFLREKFKGALMVNGGYDAETGNAAIESGEADLVAYGVLFIANPDLPERMKRKGPYNVPNKDTFYSGEEKGYIDYPKLDE